MLRPGKKFYKHPSLPALAIVVLTALLAVPTTVVLTARAEEAPTFDNPTNLGPTVNSSYKEWGPDISADGLSLYFLSRRPGGLGDADIWVTTRKTKDEPWGVPVNLGPPVNSSAFEGAPCLSADGLELYFVSGQPGSNGWLDIWVATRKSKDSPWGAPVNLGPKVNSAAAENGPSISSDGLSLYFSDHIWSPYRSAGLGKADIWVTSRKSKGDPWSSPVNLGPTVNSPYYDCTPCISSDGLSLYFQSTRPGGSGGLDIWVTSRKSKDDPWSSTVNLGPMVNSPGVENSPHISSDGSTLYFASMRPGNVGGSGDPDIWQVSLKSKAKPAKSLHQAAADGDIEQVKSLISKGADVNAEGGRLGWTPLQLAAGSGDRQVVAFLIAKGANVNAKNKPSQTPLLYAARYGHKDVAELLVSKGAEVNAKSGMERMPLYCAVGGRHKQIAELLLANGADVDAALLCAAWHGHMGATMFLLNKGANVAATDKEGRTPLHRAAKFCHKDTAGLLIAQGANLDAKDNTGATPAYTATTMSLALDQQQIVEMVKLLLAKGARVDSIHLAAFVGDTERVETFLEEGIDVDEKGKFGRTPLLMAAISGQKEMVIFLIRKGADVNAPDRSGFGPLHSAVVYPDYEVAKLLIENGADVKAKAPPFFNTSPLLVPLLTVAMRGMRFFEEDNLDKPFRYEDGNLDTDGTDEDGMVAESIRKGWPNMRDVLKLLLEQGADVSEKGLMGMTLLHNYAAKAGIKDAVELFIAHGADVNAKDKWGWTPLHYVCWKNHKDVVEFLLAKGADMNIQGEEGKTPLAVAKEEGHTEIVELLRKHGARD